MVYSLRAVTHLLQVPLLKVSVSSETALMADSVFKTMSLWEHFTRTDDTSFLFLVTSSQQGRGSTPSNGSPDVAKAQRSSTLVSAYRLRWTRPAPHCRPVYM